MAIVIGTCWTNFCAQEQDVGNIWFQRNGAAYHTAEATLDVMRPILEDRILSLTADVVWPPGIWHRWSIICGVMSKVRVKPEIIDALKNNIREAIGEIQLYTIDNEFKSWTDHVGYCMASRISHLNEIIFHY